LSNDVPAITGHEFEGVPRLPCRDCLAKRDSFTNDEFSMLHSRPFVDGVHEVFSGVLSCHRSPKPRRISSVRWEESDGLLSSESFSAFLDEDED
jgi:hypothetical protein